MNSFDFRNMLDSELFITKIYSILQESSAPFPKIQRSIPHNAVFFMLEGEYNIYVDGRKITAKENDAFYIPHSTHYHIENTQGNATFVGIYFSGNKGSGKNFFNEFQYIPGMRNMKNQFKELTRLFFLTPSGISLKLMKQLYSLLDNLVTAFLSTSEYFGYYSTIKNAVDYIENNYTSDDISSIYLANLCNVTATHFARIFRKIYNTNPKDYIIKLRMARAEEYLLYSAYSIFEIAALLGYRDPAYFSTAFKSIYGVSPSDFRKNHM